MNDKEAKDNFWRKIAEIFFKLFIQLERRIRALVRIGFFVEIDQSGGGCSFLKLLLRFWMISFVMAYGS